MIKKIKCLFVGTLIVFSMPAAIMAVEDEESNTSVIVDSDITTSSDNSLTVNSTVEVEENSISFENKKDREYNNLGAKMRFQGLSSNIEIQVRSAQVIIDKLSTIETTLSIEELALISTKFDNLLEELENVDFENEDKETLKLEMDLIKDTGKEVTKEFRELVQDFITPELKTELKETLKSIKQEVYDERKVARELLKDEILVIKVTRFLDNLGADSSKIIERIKSEELDIKDIRSELKEFIKSAKPEKINEIREDKKRYEIKSKQRAQIAKIDIKEKRDKFQANMKKKYELYEKDYKEDKQKFMKKISNDRKISKEKAKEIRDMTKEEYKERVNKIREMSKEEAQAMREMSKEEAQAMKEMSKEEAQAMKDIYKEENIVEEVTR